MKADSEFLAPADVKELTGRAKPDDQEAELKRLGLPCRRPRPNRVLVSRHHVREWLSGRAVAPSRGVNLGAIEQMEAQRAEAKKLAAARKESAEKLEGEKRAARRTAKAASPT
jgi:hypothetical protein